MIAARILSLPSALLVAVASTSAAQQPPAAQPQGRSTPGTGVAIAKLVAEPNKILMKAGETSPLKVTAYDAQGNAISDVMLRVMGPRQAFTWTDGQLHANKAGTFTAIAMAFSSAGQVTLDIPVTVTWPALRDLSIVADSSRLYTDVTIGQLLQGHLPDSTVRTDIAAVWRSSNPAIATVDRFGNV